MFKRASCGFGLSLARPCCLIAWIGSVDASLPVVAFAALCEPGRNLFNAILMIGHA